MKTIISILCIIMFLVACSPGYQQQVIIPEQVIVEEHDEPLPGEDNSEDAVNDSPSENLPEPTQEEQVVAPDPQNLTDKEKERRTFSLIDLSTITAQNCQSQLQVWDRNIENINEDIEETGDELEDEEDELEVSEQLYQDAKQDSSQAVIDNARSRRDKDEDDVNRIEDELDELDELLFRTEYTYSEIRNICLAFEQKSQSSS